ncbi:hypothetical protein AB0C12_38345 [Actinoplanes sp. NPDC048967]|uniref:hypothetical protein n=1 Tax=Actinoplanes sp. NPDC048967 TaxID=3155269 RepID=UPI0033FC5B1C
MTWKIALFIGLVGLLMLVVSAYLTRRARALAAGRPIDVEAMRADVGTALDRDDPATAVRIYRQHTGAGLLQASKAVDQIARDRR